MSIKLLGFWNLTEDLVFLKCLVSKEDTYLGKFVRPSVLVCPHGHLLFDGNRRFDTLVCSSVCVLPSFRWLENHWTCADLLNHNVRRSYSSVGAGATQQSIEAAPVPPEYQTVIFASQIVSARNRWDMESGVGWESVEIRASQLICELQVRDFWASSVELIDEGNSKS